MPARRRPRGRSAGLATAVALALLAGCSSSPARPAVSATVGGTSAAASDTAGTAAVTESSGGTGATSTCDQTVGSQLRERTTSAGSTVTLLAGTLPCAGVGVWTARFALDGMPDADPAPQFAGTYTGRTALGVTLPAADGACAASVVVFTPGTTGASGTQAATQAAQAARAELATWPAATAVTVPGAPILRGHTSSVLAGTLGGDPARCSPGEAVASPYAAVGDCWLAMAPAAGGAGATRFTATTCGAPHTHEVYAVSGLSPADFEAEGRPQGLSASAWARKDAAEICNAARSSIDLAHDVSLGDVHLEYLWPSTLSYPPPTGVGWSRAQVVCLARWKDGKPSDRHLLHR